MDDNIEPSNVYIRPPTNILDEENNDKLDGIVNDQQEWEERWSYHTSIEHSNNISIRCWITIDD